MTMVPSPVTVFLDYVVHTFPDGAWRWCGWDEIRLDKTHGKGEHDWHGYWDTEKNLRLVDFFFLFLSNFLWWLKRVTLGKGNPVWRSDTAWEKEHRILSRDRLYNTNIRMLLS